MKIPKSLLLAAALLSSALAVNAEKPFTLGADISGVTELEAHGVKFENTSGKTTDLYEESKDRARDLEKQLSEALAKGGTNIWMIIAIISALAFIATLLFK